MRYSLYFHVPFCTRKCDYCHFYVIPDHPRFHNQYITALQKEWELRSPILPPNKPLSIYFGGGTPSLLPPQTIAGIINWISPDKECEITLEVNPENVSYERMKAFKDAGINRISLGIQSLDDALLKILTRTHSAHDALQAIAIISNAGFENISIDLMYDLPEQTLSNWQTTLEKAIQLPITHLSFYNLTIEPHTAFYKKQKSLKLPDDQLSLDMLLLAIEILNKGGFSRYEISAFCRDGKISHHNSGYWTGRPFLGFGPSAFSYWNGSRFSNTAHLHRYAKLLQQGKDPVDFEETLPHFEKLKESLAIGLRRLEGVLLQEWPETIIKGIEKLKNLELLQECHSFVQLTEKGLLFYDTVATEIMAL